MAEETGKLTEWSACSTDRLPGYGYNNFGSCKRNGRV